MKDIAIYGAGGFGRELLCLLKACIKDGAEWHFVGFFDDGLSVGEFYDGYRVLGNLKAINEWDTEIDLVLGIANVEVVNSLVNAITNQRVSFPNVVAPDVLFFDRESVNMGRGNVIFFSSRISVNVSIGDFNISNSMLSLGHDVVLGNHNVFGPCVRVSGCVTIHDNCHFAVNTTILQGIQVKSLVRTAPGSLLTRSPKKVGLYIGNPARKFNF